MEITYKVLDAKSIGDFLHDLIRLRIEVFREFPYLYEGSESYERKYLSRYLNSPNSFVLLACVGPKVVGATTGLPLSEETAEITKPLENAGYELDKGFYFGESIVLRDFRGQGMGHKFFHAREEFARSVVPGLKFCCFCTVKRDGHPLTPSSYRPLDKFWQRMGYTKQAGLAAKLDWQDVDQECETSKELTFWTKQF